MLNRSGRSLSVLFILSLLVVAAGSLFVWALFGCPKTGIDDAYIFFVYARHFSEGHGFVYNVGEGAVEGFTSLLWTLICSVGWRFFQPIELFLLTLNVLLGALTLSACLRRTERPLVFLLLLAAAPAWFAWCQVTLMESGLWCLLITLATLAAAEQRGKSLAIWLPLMVITRPESMLWGAWILLVFWISAKRGARLRSILLPGLLFCGSILGLILFRLWYFGHPVPNTYYAKISPSFFSNIWHGLNYLGLYLGTNPIVVYVAALALWLLSRRPKDARNPFRILIYLLPGLGIPVLVGGDHFGSFRFFQPVWPLLCLIASSCFIPENADAPGTKKATPPWTRTLSIPLVLFIAGWLIYPLTANLKHEFRIAREGLEEGQKLEQMFCDLEQMPTIAVITAGGHKLTYSGTALDLMGLNWPEMAHAPIQSGGMKNHTAFNRSVFYDHQPDILLCGDSAKFDNRVLKGLHDEPRFKEQYRKQPLCRNGVSFNAYYRLSFLSEIREE